VTSIIEHPNGTREVNGYQNELGRGPAWLVGHDGGRIMAVAMAVVMVPGETMNILIVSVMNTIPPNIRHNIQDNSLFHFRIEKIKVI
jgi:hypothetical protein